MFKDIFPWVMFLVGVLVGAMSSAGSVNLAAHGMALQSAEKYAQAVRSPEALEQAIINSQQELNEARLRFYLPEPK